MREQYYIIIRNRRYRKLCKQSKPQYRRINVRMRQKVTKRVSEANAYLVTPHEGYHYHELTQ